VCVCEHPCPAVDIVCAQNVTPNPAPADPSVCCPTPTCPSVLCVGKKCGDSCSTGEFPAQCDNSGQCLMIPATCSAK
jgi:hypothetical protein